jgi:uncharacterized protein (DUF924 family)
LIDELLEDAETGTASKKLLNWNVAEDPSAALAKVIVLDQFCRSAYRGTSKAFAGDEICAHIVKTLIIEKKWFFEKYSPTERFFLVVSIQHSENLLNQKLGVAHAHQVGRGADPEVGEYFCSLKGFPNEHHDVIERFGRFPHRNKLLVSVYINLFSLLCLFSFLYIT